MARISDRLRKRLEKQFGADGLYFGNEIPPVTGGLSSGSLSLDLALGGGIPRGKIIEIYGGYSSGKTSLALNFIAQAQKKDMTTAFLDVEGTFDEYWATQMGVNSEDLFLVRKTGGEQFLNAAKMMVQEGVDIIVLDSVAALTTKAEVEKDIGEATMAGQARLMSQALRTLSPLISQNGTIFFFLNQTRTNIGVMYGNPEVTSGGKALGFFSSARLALTKSTVIKEGKEHIGQLTKVRVTKNKFYKPNCTAEFDFMYGTHGYEPGINNLKSVVTIAVDRGIITRAGSWFSYGETKIGQGAESVAKLLDDNPELYDEVLKKIFEN
jgi:recombination protein RecA